MSTIPTALEPAANSPAALNCALPANTKSDIAWVSTTESPASRAITA